jgi:transaldolase
LLKCRKLVLGPRGAMKRKKDMVSKLDQLKTITTVVADTGDIQSIKAFQPTDCTTNPTLILKAASMPEYAPLVREAVDWGRKNNASLEAITNRLAVSFGVELAAIVPGRVSTEVDADVSFDTGATLLQARTIIADYAARGIGRERILIKIAATWEGIEAARILQEEGIDCNLTLIFSRVQAEACAQAGVFLISPFVGRILDWYVKNEGKTYTPQMDPGVVSVREIYDFYKTHDVKTIVMGASFRHQEQVEALAGCDRLTIAPAFLESLSSDHGLLVRHLHPQSATGILQHVDEKTFRFRLNEDAMTTEKLAEGIRAFTKDLRSLRALVADKRLAKE